MNILFFSLQNIISLDQSDIYSDLIRKFVSNGHYVYVVSPWEKRFNKDEEIIVGDSYKIIKPKVGNITNTPFIEKGLSILGLRHNIISAIKKHVGNVDIELFLLATPPVTEDIVVKYVKSRYRCKVYLLLKDIWPASMNDLKIPGGEPLKRIVSFVFSKWERRLFLLSDWIGCMSQANNDYVLKHNQYLDKNRVHINPNSIDPKYIASLDRCEIMAVREKYGIPKDKLCFVYGGTLGIGQNVPFIVECLKATEDLNCHFVISGRGTQYHYLKEYEDSYRPRNLTLINGLPKEDYEKLQQACDVGLVFLRYTAQTPNFPSRILGYMEMELPILACTDPVTDVGKVVEEGGFGWACLSDSPKSFKRKVEEILISGIGNKGKVGREYLETNYSSDVSFHQIMRALGRE